jgi:hypothetical protein
VQPQRPFTANALDALSIFEQHCGPSQIQECNDAEREGQCGDQGYHHHHSKEPEVPSDLLMPTLGELLASLIN